MRGEWVAIDLETTGLDTAKDAIIELAAVRFRDGVEVGSYSKLVNPRRAIPQIVTDITGISNETIANAQPIDVLLPEFIAFVGRSPVVAHMASFDLGMLRIQHNAFRENVAIDTLDLASMLLPRAARINLRSLALELGLTLENAHRAEDDARATGLLYWHLWQKLIDLPRSIVAEIATAGDRLQWMTAPVLQAALLESVEKPVRSLPGIDRPSDALEMAPAESGRISSEEIQRAFAADGALAENFAAYETRPQQLEMALAVSEVFSDGGALLAEAGTGVGKSLAYLLPAALWARRNRRPVVISTHTLGLQDQLMNNDIPRLRSAVGFDVKAAVLKGRANYLCLSHFERLRERGPRDQTEFVMLGRLLVWLHEGGNGDRTELPPRGPQETAVWRRLSADEGFGCNPKQCTLQRSGVCPYSRAYRGAEDADVIIVNHALLSTPAVESAVSFDTVVIDEAHNLEDAITSGATRWLDLNSASEPVKQLGNFKRGDLAAVYQQLQGAVSAEDVMRVEKFIDLLSGALTEYQAALKRVFDRLAELRDELIQRAGNDQFMGVRVLANVLAQAEFAPTIAAGRDLVEFAQIIGPALDQLIKRIQTATSGKEDSGLRELMNSIFAQRVALRDNGELLAGLLSDNHGNWVYWLSGSDNQFPLAVNRAPLDVGAALEQTLWKQRAVVLTSATLRTGTEAESFDHLRARLHVPEPRELILGSPFAYKDNVLVFVPQDTPPPASKDGHQRAIDQAIIQLAVALNGRVLALFTSHAQVRQTTRNITARLGIGGIQVLSQSEGGGRQVLIDQFLSADKAVLLGTRMFWEGVDIPGDRLSAVLIAKLPFPVPNEPVVAARSEMYTDPFNEYSVPEAILMFRQGFGRLIRTATDRGIVAILDSRILTARYGKAFLAALPELNVVRGPLANLGKAATDWLPNLK